MCICLICLNRWTSEEEIFLSNFQPACWPDYGSNTESVGELWLGLLRFYTEEFDFKEHVICIRRKNLLTTFKKQWTSKYIVIEGIVGINTELIDGWNCFKTHLNKSTLLACCFSLFHPAGLGYFLQLSTLSEILALRS